MHAVVWGWLSYAIRDDLRTGHFDRPQVLHLFESTSKPTCFFFKPGIFFTKKNIICFSVRFSVLMLMDFWQLEMDTLTVGSVFGVVELKGQCMRPLPQLGSWAKLSPRFFWGNFPKVEKKTAASDIQSRKKRGEKPRISCDDFCGVFLEGCRCVQPIF